MFRIAVLASGRGSNFKAILEHCTAGHINAEIALLLSNVPTAPALQIAERAGIPVWTRDHKEFANRAAFDAAMLDAMRDAHIDGVVLAGYMRLLSPAFIKAYQGKILNIHPSLLPSFTGVSGAADALAYGVKVTGCTVHFVVDELDAGPVIIQAVVPIQENDNEDSLMPRIHAMEHRIYPQAVAWFAPNRLSVKNRTVTVSPGGDPSKTPCTSAGGFTAFVHPPLETLF